MMLCPCVKKQAARCSNKGFSPISSRLPDPAGLDGPKAESWQCGCYAEAVCAVVRSAGHLGEIWCRLVKDFGKLFSVVAGQPQRIDEHRSKSSSRRYRMRQEARELMATV